MSVMLLHVHKKILSREKASQFDPTFSQTCFVTVCHWTPQCPLYLLVEETNNTADIWFATSMSLQKCEQSC